MSESKVDLTFGLNEQGGCDLIKLDNLNVGEKPYNLSLITFIKNIYRTETLIVQ